MLSHYRVMAAYNSQMNRQFYAACSELTDAERKQDRGAFFRSIHGTLNHLLLVDRLWLGSFTDNPATYTSLDEELYADFGELQAERERMLQMKREDEARKQAVRDEQQRLRDRIAELKAQDEAAQVEEPQDAAPISEPATAVTTEKPTTSGSKATPRNPLADVADSWAMREDLIAALMKTQDIDAENRSEIAGALEALQKIVAGGEMAASS